MNSVIFIQYVLQNTGIELIQEYKFHEKRRWRIDFVSLKHMIAIEIEGGAWKQGRHTRGKGFIADMEKYNEIAIHGFKLLRFTPEQMSQKKTLETILRAI